MLPAWMSTTRKPAGLPFSVCGTAVAEIRGLDTVRGRQVYHSVFRINGSMLMFKVRDVYESWFDPETLVSVVITNWSDHVRRLLPR